MDDVLPELKVNNVLVKTDVSGRVTTFTVRKVGKGRKFDEPVYFLRGAFGVNLKTAYAGEDLAAMGYRIQG